MSEGYTGYSSVQILHALSEQLDFLLFHTALLLIFLDFLYKLLHNYLFLEVFQVLTHCHCKPSHARVSDLYDYQMFYHSTSILRDSMQTDSIKDFIKPPRRLRLVNLQILIGALSFLPAFLHCFEI